MLPSLLDFKPEDYGLPACTDAVAGAIPVDPVWRIAGDVVRGFGRGSKVPLRPICSIYLCMLSFRSGCSSCMCIRCLYLQVMNLLGTVRLLTSCTLTFQLQYSESQL